MAASTGDRPLHLLIANGGTGGHIFPGLAVAEAILATGAEVQTSFVGSPAGIESRVIPKAGLGDLHLIEVRALKGQTRVKTLGNLLRLPAAGLRAANLLRKLRPDMVLGAGGYSSGPVVAVAAARGIPTAIMEQNARLGLTNKLLSRFVDRAFLTFEEAADDLQGATGEVVGNPVRPSLVKAAAEAGPYRPPDPDGPFHVLVVGGSGGAGSLNAGVPRALMGLEERLARRVICRHQVGRGRLGEVEGAYDGFAGEVELVEFIDDMSEAYRWLDLLICRAGASTLAEVLAFGAPAVLVPFSGVDDHQVRNARGVVQKGAALMVGDDEIGTGRTTRLISGLMDNPQSLAQLSERAQQIAWLDAADRVAQRCLSMMRAEEG